MAKKPRAFDPSEDIDPEDIRTAFPELSRCDHCGRLDGKTKRMSFVADAPRPDSPEDYLPPGYWLHEACAEWFIPPRTELIVIEGRVAGAIASYDGGESWESWRFIAGQMRQFPPEGGTTDRQDLAATAVVWRQPYSRPPLGSIRQRLRVASAPDRTVEARAFWTEFNDRQKSWRAMDYAKRGEYIYIENATPILLYLLTPI
jgi:hypothetical protein